MPRLTTRNPTYRRRRASGHAIVTLSGQDIYLGPHGSKASRSEYDRLIGEWLANGRMLHRDGTPLDVNVVILAYRRHAEETDRSEDGSPSDHAKKVKRALGFPRRLYGHTPAAQFGPLALRAVRRFMLPPPSLHSGPCDGFRPRRRLLLRGSVGFRPPGIGQPHESGLRHARRSVRDSPTPRTANSSLRPVKICLARRGVSNPWPRRRRVRGCGGGEGQFAPRCGRQ